MLAGVEATGAVPFTVVFDQDMPGQAEQRGRVGERADHVGAALCPARSALAPSRNWRFQFPIACSENFSRRAASATVTSPCNTDNTI